MMGVYKKIAFVSLVLPIFIGLSTFITYNVKPDDIVQVIDSEPRKLVYLGGESININMDASGVIITNNNGEIKAGDILYKINDNSVNNRFELNNVKNNIAASDIIITYLHNNELLTKTISNDELKNIEGINNLTGNVTITYINPDNMKYAAVAHSVINNVSITNNVIGTINTNHINEIIKSTDDTVGHFKSSKGVKIGTIDTINETGMYGTYDKQSGDLIEIGTAKKGKAYIVTTLDTNKKAYYEIEIKKVYQNQNDMQIDFIIKDQNLINKTNGILKGMSGSPIVQDNKLVGAVSHAVNGSNKTGYGLLIEKMLENTN